MSGVTTPARDPLVDALVQTSFATMAVLSRLAAEHDLSVTQLRVLAILRDRRLRISVLAAYLGLERSTLSGLVDRAERRGLVSRGASPSDGRAVHVFLAPAGKTLAAQVEAQVAHALAPATEALTAAERRRLADLLQRTLDTRDPGGAPTS